MRKTKILTSIILASLVCLAAQAQKATISGTIGGLYKAGIMLELCTVSNGHIIPADTLMLPKNGRYSFQLSPTDTEMYLLRLHATNIPSTVQLIAKPGDNLTMDLVYHNQYNYTQTSSVKGSDELQVIHSFNNIIYNTMKEGVRLENEFTSTTITEEQKKRITNEYSQLQSRQSHDIYQLLKNNPDKLISAFFVTIFDKEASDYLELYEAIDKALTPRHPGNSFVKHVNDIVRTTIGTGREAPDIALPDTSGTIRQLSDLRGKIVLLDFWASWCRPCRMENPNVVKLYKTYHEQGFEVFSVSLDNKRSDWLRAIATDGLEWSNHVSDLRGWKSAGGATYGITSIPATVLIDRDGRIVARNLRGNELSAKVKELIEKK